MESPPDATIAARSPRKILLVGWDAADWQFALPLLEAGSLPALASLVERGVMGNIATLQPALSPMLWTSIATGKLADQHGVLGFLEPDRLNSAAGVRPRLGRFAAGKGALEPAQRPGPRRARRQLVREPSRRDPARGWRCPTCFFEPRDPAAHAPWSPPAGSVAPVELTGAAGVAGRLPGRHRGRAVA